MEVSEVLREQRRAAGSAGGKAGSSEVKAISGKKGGSSKSEAKLAACRATALAQQKPCTCEPVGDKHKRSCPVYMRMMMKVYRDRRSTSNQ